MIIAIPNVSEGRRLSVVQSIATAIRTTAGVRLLDWSADADHHRSVFTFIGDAVALTDAVIAIYGIGLGAIDMRAHRGAHPRIGAIDVVPFVPLEGSSMRDCVALARETGQQIADRFQVPIYLYEEAARTGDRRNLADIRRGGFEGLSTRMTQPGWEPDFGPAHPHPTAGASAVGARKVLVAYNINLASDSLAAAQAIARAVREKSGGRPGVKAIGLRLPTRGLVQVSMNLVDYERTNMAQAFAVVRREAERHGIRIEESEVIGLAPSAAFGGASPDDLLLRSFTRDCVLEERLRTTR